MPEFPKNIEEKRVENISDILAGRPGVTGQTPYGKCLINRRHDTYEIRLIEESSSKPLIIFFVDIATGTIRAQSEKDQIKAWKDEEKTVNLTPDDLIESFKED
jgi:hypothetical protein